MSYSAWGGWRGIMMTIFPPSLSIQHQPSTFNACLQACFGKRMDVFFIDKNTATAANILLRPIEQKLHQLPRSSDKTKCIPALPGAAPCFVIGTHGLWQPETATSKLLCQSKRAFMCTLLMASNETVNGLLSSHEPFRCLLGQLILPGELYRRSWAGMKW